MGLIPGLDVGVSPQFMQSLVSQTMYYLMWTLLIMLLIAAMFMIYYYITFNIKVTIFPINGSKEGVFYLGRKKKNRIKWTNKRTQWRKLWPLFNNENIEPFDSNCIYGNEIYATEVDGKLEPLNFKIEQQEKNILAELSPVPHSHMNWLVAMHQKNEIEYSKMDWWTENKALIITIVICGINLCLCGFTIYLAYKFMGAGRQDVQALTEAIKNFGVMKGVVPAGQ